MRFYLKEHSNRAQIEIASFIPSPSVEVMPGDARISPDGKYLALVAKLFQIDGL